MGKGRFWMRNIFIEEYARELSVYQQAVLMALTRYVDASGVTFVGVRRLAGNLGIDKSTVSNAMKALELYGYIVHLGEKKRGKVSRYIVYGVPFQEHEVSGLAVPKEDLKEGIEEGRTILSNDNIVRGSADPPDLIETLENDVPF